MTLIEMIRKRGSRPFATATVATPVTREPSNLIPVANVAAVATIPKQIVMNTGSELTHCEHCGGGYWIRETFASFLQCGRCFPTESHVEIMFTPGGTVALIRRKPTSPCEVGLTPPFLPGWYVTYLDSGGRLCGGSEDREHGTVQDCRWERGNWTLYLTDSQQIPLWLIRAVGQTDATGRICAAWTVREHGYDGNGKPK